MEGFEHHRSFAGGGTVGSAGGKDAKRHKGEASIVKSSHLAPCGRGQNFLANLCELRNLGEGSIGSQEIKRSGCQASLEARKLGRYEDRLLKENSSFLPLLGKDKRMGNNQYPPQPSLIREGATHVDMLDNSCQHLSCNRESSTLFVITDSAADPQSQDSCNKNEITTSNAPHSPRNDTKRTYRPNVLLSYRLKNKLSSPFTLHSSLNKKVAFTLAEVLIILGIIGVVAAMTIPTLISHHRAKVFEAQLKKSYSSISNATKMLVAQGISPYDDFSYDNAVSQRAEILMNQTRTYAKIMLGTVCEKDNINTKCGTSGSVWKNLTGANAIHRGAISAEKAFMLNDGTCILIGNYHWFIVDINGPKKGPNRVGYDIHTFKITEDNNVKPVPEGDHDTRTCTLSSKESTDIYLGYGCTPYAMMNKNPDGDGDYWHDFLGL